MKVLAKVLALCFPIFFAVIFSWAAEAQQQEATTNKTGEALYKQRCAACHEGAVPRAPNRAALKQMSPENVRVALLGGSMAVEGLGLSLAEIADLAEFLTGRRPVKGANPCGRLLRCGSRTRLCGSAREAALERLGRGPRATPFSASSDGATRCGASAETQAE